MAALSSPPASVKAARVRAGSNPISSSRRNFASSALPAPDKEGRLSWLKMMHTRTCTRRTRHALSCERTTRKR